MTTENLTKEQRKRINKIIESLGQSKITFKWSETKEGHDYWYRVRNALKRIANSEPYDEKEIILNGKKYRLVKE